MELTYEQWYQKDLRRRFSPTGWTLLVYYGIMNVAVILAVVVEMIVRMMAAAVSQDLDGILAAAESAAGSAWGYLLAVMVGLLILLCWKKPAYWKNEIWAKGKPMKVGSFFAILCIFLSGQLVFQIVTVAAELFLNGFGLTMLEGLESISGSSDTFSMFLYSAILAPISEEILFRGLIQRGLMPYGKKFAILCSAFTFGIFHGNLLQSPYAFLVGLVLGYVAAEYSIGWAMVLHMINNLVIADVLSRLTQGLPELAATLILYAVILGFAIGAVVVLIVKRREISRYLRREHIPGIYLKSFFSSPGMVTLMIVMGLNMIVTAFMIVGPM